MFFSLESSQSKQHAEQSRDIMSPPPGSKTQASLSGEQPPTPGGGTHPSKEYLLVFGMSMMSMKPLFPEKGRDESYRVACLTNHGVTLLCQRGIKSKKCQKGTEKHGGAGQVSQSLMLGKASHRHTSLGGITSDTHPMISPVTPSVLSMHPTLPCSWDTPNSAHQWSQPRWLSTSFCACKSNTASQGRK